MKQIVITKTFYFKEFKEDKNSMFNTFKDWDQIKNQKGI